MVSESFCYLTLCDKVSALPTIFQSATPPEKSVDFLDAFLPTSRAVGPLEAGTNQLVVAKVTILAR